MKPRPGHCLDSALNQTRTWITGVAVLATFLWLLAPDLKASPAVLWPSVLTVGLAGVL
jgi:hypothetical protein